MLTWEQVRRLLVRGLDSEAAGRELRIATGVAAGWPPRGQGSR